jgi:hypothetical protein
MFVKTLLLLGAVAALSAEGALAAGDALTLVAKGRPRAVIVLAAAPSPAAVEGARILAEHLHQISGARLAVVKESDLGGATAREGRIFPAGKGAAEAFILVGEGELARQLGVTAEGLGPGGIRIRTTGNALVLLGPDTYTPSDPWGTRYAVTRFLEDSLGCRFLWPGETGKVVPKQSTIALPALDVRFAPLLRQRIIRNMGHNDRLQAGLDRLSFTKQDYERGRAAAEQTTAASGNWFGWQGMGGSLQLASGHAFGDLWTRYGKEHPEWFALQPNGSRDQSLSPDRPRLCKSNPELIAAIAREKIAELDQHPERHSVSVGPNDGGQTTFCMCPACKALDPPEGRKIMLWDFTSGTRRDFEYVSLTDRMVYFWNALAEQITKVHPEALLTADAYSAYSAPPVRRKLHPNIVIRFVPISYSSDKARQQGRADWDAWAAMAPKIYFRPNLLLYARREGTLANYTRKMAEDFRYLAHHSMIGTDFDSCIGNWATQGLNYYVLARLHWDPDQDVERIVDDYCHAGFGKAAGDVKRYWQRVEQLTDQAAAHELTSTEPYTPEVIAELRTLLDAANRHAAGAAAVRARLAFLRAGLEFTALQAEAHHMLARAAETDHAAAARLLDRRYVMMRDLFRKQPLAINVGYVCWGEGERFAPLGRTGPTPAVKAKPGEADEQGRPAK